MPHASIEAGPDELVVKVSSSAIGDTVAPIPAVIDGSPMSFGVSVPLLSEAIHKMRSEQVQIGLHSPEAPIVITEVGRDDFVFVIMPSIITYRKVQE
jgi:DNA polymerase III sliding clamp (beta) subunit (PCNA family)